MVDIYRGRRSAALEYVFAPSAALDVYSGAV